MRAYAAALLALASIAEASDHDWERLGERDGIIIVDPRQHAGAQPMPCRHSEGRGLGLASLIGATPARACNGQ